MPTEAQGRLERRANGIAAATRPWTGVGSSDALAVRATLCIAQSYMDSTPSYPRSRFGPPRVPVPVHRYD